MKVGRNEQNGADIVTSRTLPDEVTLLGKLRHEGEVVSLTFLSNPTR
jgi:hypothetical protein